MIVHEKAKGAAAARNSGIQKAEGRFIAFLDADDIWLDKKLEVQIAFMMESGLDLSYGAFFVAGLGAGRTKKLYEPPIRLTYSDLLGGCPIGCLTAVYDREAVGTRLFPSIARGQDWALWLQIAREGKCLGRYPGVHAVYHTSRRSLSSNKLAKMRDVWRIYRAYEEQSRVQSARWLVKHALSVARRRWIYG